MTNTGTLLCLGNLSFLMLVLFIELHGKRYDPDFNGLVQNVFLQPACLHHLQKMILSILEHF